MENEAKRLDRSEVLSIIQKNHPELRALKVKYLALFGSFSREEARPESDVDFLVDFDSPVGLLHFVRVKIFLEKIFPGHKIDLSMPETIHEEFKDGILLEAIRVA